MIKKSTYDFIYSQNDNRLNMGFQYEGQIFRNTLGNQTLSGDQNRTDLLNSIEVVVFNLIETTKQIKNFFNYVVPKNNPYVR